MKLVSMEWLSACVVSALLFGCGGVVPIELSSAGRTNWSNFKKFDVVAYRKLGISVELPSPRFKERVQYNDKYPYFGPNRVALAIHQIGNGRLAETSEKIVIFVELFTAQEFQEYLRRERSCAYPDESYESKRSFVSHLVQKRDELGIHYRQDHRGLDGTVAIASALNRVDRVKQDSTDEKADVAAIRRILGSVKFIPKESSR